MRDSSCRLYIFLFIVITFFLQINCVNDSAETWQDISWSNPKSWVVYNRQLEVVNRKDRKAIRLVPGENDGCVFLQNFEFQDGVIKVDIANPHLCGLIFRVKNGESFEGFMFRQRNRHAIIRYFSPPNLEWNSVLESNQKVDSVQVAAKDWYRIRLEVYGETASVYVGDTAQPVLVIKELQKGITVGTIGLWSAHDTEMIFKNLHVHVDMPMAFR